MVGVLGGGRNTVSILAMAVFVLYASIITYECFFTTNRDVLEFISTFLKGTPRLPLRVGEILICQQPSDCEFCPFCLKFG